MLLETTTTTKKMVEVSFPLYAKDEEYNRLYYVSKKRNIISLQVLSDGQITIEDIPYQQTPCGDDEFTTNKTTLLRVATLPNIHPRDFWSVFDKALQSLQETVYIDRGNLFK